MAREVTFQVQVHVLCKHCTCTCKHFRATVDGSSALNKLYTARPAISQRPSEAMASVAPRVVLALVPLVCIAILIYSNGNAIYC